MTDEQQRCVHEEATADMDPTLRQKQLRQYIVSWEKLRRHSGGDRRERGWRYATVESFILEHGRFWGPRVEPLPSGVHRGPNGECFKTAWEMTLKDPVLTYVEGWAAGYLPVHHAWVVDAEGRVLEVTWPADAYREMAAYFGVAFQRTALLRLLQYRKRFGVLYPEGLAAAEQATYPLMVEDPAGFIASKDRLAERAL